MDGIILKTQSFVFCFLKEARQKEVESTLSDQLPCTVFKTAWIQTANLLFGEISQKERSYCWKILSAEAMEVKGKKLNPYKYM